MIDKAKLRQTVEKAIEGTDIFIVDIEVSADNRIVVELDSPHHLDINTCAEITRKIEADFDRDAEDYELEVGSAGLTTPFKVKAQYLKNIGNEIEVLTTDGRKLRGILAAVDADDYTVEVTAKEKVEGQKKPQLVTRPVIIRFDQTKRANYLINFK